MNAIPRLAVSIAPLPAMSSIAVSVPLSPDKLTFSDQLSISATDTGLIIYKSISPICWVMPGYHKGQCDRHHKRCDFVDVAYHRQTQNGVNLETIDFQSLEDALEFVTELLGGEL